VLHPEPGVRWPAQVARLPAFGDAVPAPLDPAGVRAAVRKSVRLPSSHSSPASSSRTLLPQRTSRQTASQLSPEVPFAARRHIPHRGDRCDRRRIRSPDSWRRTRRWGRCCHRRTPRWVDDAVAASGQGAIRVAAVAVDDVPVVTLLVALLPTVPAHLDLASVRAAVAVLGVASSQSSFPSRMPSPHTGTTGPRHAAASNPASACWGRDRTRRHEWRLGGVAVDEAVHSRGQRGEAAPLWIVICPLASSRFSAAGPLALRLPVV